MNFNKAYPKEKRTFILNKSEAELWAFFNEIPDSQTKKKLINKLSQKLGLKKNRKEDVRQRFKKLFFYAIRLEETSPNTEQVWQGFLLIWTLWIESNPKLKECLENYDNSADFPEDGTIIPPNSSLDIECFTHLYKANLPNSLIH